MATNLICNIEGCGKPVVNKRGWCAAHYHRWQRHGDPRGGLTAKGEPREYIETTVLAYTKDDCLRWPFGLCKTGYAVYRCGGRNKVIAVYL